MSLWAITSVNCATLTINSSSITNRIWRTPASSAVFEHNRWALNSLSQSLAVSDFGGRKYSIDDAIVALSWAKSVICDLKSVIVIVRIKWNMEH